MVRDQAGGLNGEAQAHEVPIGHEDMAQALRRMADRQDGEASAVERVRGVGHLDFVGFGRRWVLEGGIMLGSRLTPWITATGGSFSGNGYATGCCCA